MVRIQCSTYCGRALCITLPLCGCYQTIRTSRTQRHCMASSRSTARSCLSTSRLTLSFGRAAWASSASQRCHIRCVSSGESVPVLRIIGDSNHIHSPCWLQNVQQSRVIGNILDALALLHFCCEELLHGAVHRLVQVHHRHVRLLRVQNRIR